jgi:hypothetical protein
MNKPFDPTKPVQTRNGQKARIICTDRVSLTHPIIALVGEACCLIYTVSGTYYSDGTPSLNDLINIPTKREGWVNVYDGFGASLWASESAANKNADPARIACVRIEWEE